MCTHQVPEPNVRQLVRNRRDDLRVVRVAVRAVVVEQVVGTGIYTGIKKYFIFIYSFIWEIAFYAKVMSPQFSMAANLWCLTATMSSFGSGSSTPKRPTK